MSEILDWLAAVGILAGILFFPVLGGVYLWTQRSLRAPGELFPTISVKIKTNVK